MTDKEPTTEEPTKEELSAELDRGFIRSMFPEYPGHIQFPYPLMLHHVSTWWKMAVDANKKLDKESLEFHMNQWKAYRHLLVEFEGWHIENVLVGDVKEDRVPALLVSFVTSLGEQYVLNQLSPKVRGVLRSIL